MRVVNRNDVRRIRKAGGNWFTYTIRYTTNSGKKHYRKYCVYLAEYSDLTDHIKNTIRKTILNSENEGNLIVSAKVIKGLENKLVFNNIDGSL